MRRLALAACLVCVFALSAVDGRARPLGLRSGHTICRITGYVATGNRTATGTWPRVQHTVAVNPGLIPYGARVRIAGLRPTYRAEDTGALAWQQIDVFVGSVAEAYAITSSRACRWWS